MLSAPPGMDFRAHFVQNKMGGGEYTHKINGEFRNISSRTSHSHMDGRCREKIRSKSRCRGCVLVFPCLLFGIRYRDVYGQQRRTAALLAAVCPRRCHVLLRVMLHIYLCAAVQPSFVDNSCSSGLTVSGD